MNFFTKDKKFKLSQLQSSQAHAIRLWQKILMGVIISVILIVFLNTFQTQIKNYFYFMTAPFFKAFWQSGDNVSDFFESFLNAGGITQENNNLKQENQQLLSQINLLHKTIKQSQSIKEVIKNTQKDDFKFILAEIIGLDSDFIMLNKGSDDGILENMPVISGQKVVYGKIFKVYKNFSQVMLISNKNSVLDIKVGPWESLQVQQDNNPEKNSIYGAVKGGGKLSLYLDLVPLEAEINQGDVLISSALEGIFPKDLLVGKIISKNKNDLKPFQTAQIQPFFDVKNVDNLFIITDYKK